jgi:hypothetical protein
MTPEERLEYDRAARQRQRERNGITGRRRGRPHAAGIELGSPRPDAETLLESRRRACAPYRSLAGWLMGDPPAGFSALDKRKS